jgi:hypothetical protein
MEADCPAFLGAPACGATDLARDAVKFIGRDWA